MRITTLITFVLLSFLSFSQTIDPAYKNFDFKAGEKTLFDGNVLIDIKDKVNQKWIIEGGEATVTDFEEGKCISIDAYYTKLVPVLFGNKKLPDSFTVEYDTWLDAGYDGNPGIEIHLLSNDKEITITPNKHNLTVLYPADGNESKENPEEYFGENKFYNRWVHISIAVCKTHLLVYLDQTKMIDLADCRLKPASISVTGNTADKMKILLKNFRIATGFPAKLLFENNKFITHAIKFDVNKYTLKPESITVIKEVYEYLQQNKTVRLEIGGHTDSDGTAAYNLTLSQQRAEAVMNQLVSMGVDKERLEAKGYGQSKPTDSQNTLEAKANNRRVEFTKLL